VVPPVAVRWASCAATTLAFFSPKSPPKLGEVAEREGISVVVLDSEFAEVVDEASLDAELLSADRCAAGGIWEIAATSRRCPSPKRRSRLVILTSGTTGPPKGARRENRAPSGDAMGMFTRVP
jgi:acyl-CoA synthetase (AMP-forming)/AMP-acid ligase II